MSATCPITWPVAGLSTAIVWPLPDPFVLVVVTWWSTVAMRPLLKLVAREILGSSESNGGLATQPKAARGRPLGGSARPVQLDPLDHRVVVRPVARTRRQPLNRVDGLHPGRHLAEDRVLAVQPRSGVGRDDEELRAVRVRPCVGHRQRAAHDAVLVELVRERVAGAARAGAGRVAALDHEVLDDAVEDHPVVEAVARELLEVLDGLGCVLVEQLDLDRTVVGVHRRLAHRRRATSRRSFTPRTSLPLTLSTTSSARFAGTSTNANLSSSRTLWMSSPSRCEPSTIALTMSAGSSPCERPAPTSSLTVPSRSRRGFVCRGRRASRRSAAFTAARGRAGSRSGVPAVSAARGSCDAGSGSRVSRGPPPTRRGRRRGGRAGSSSTTDAASAAASSAVAATGA